MSVGNTEPSAEQKPRHVLGARRDDTCDHGSLESKSDIYIYFKCRRLIISWLKMKAGEGTTPVTTACPEAGKK